MKATIAVTGARGLIGKYIVECLLDMGWGVRTLSRTASSLQAHDNLSFIQGDLGERNALDALLDGVEGVFHCAAELNDESLMFDVNVKGTQVLLELMKKVPTIQYFCYLSSAGVVGPTSDLIVDEETTCEPNSIYEQSKYEAEQLVLNAKLEMNVCVLRPANVFDVIRPGILSYALKNSHNSCSFKDKVSVFIKGHEGTHLVHAKDVASAALYFMNKPLEKPEVFFVSYDDDDRNTVLGVYNLCVLMQEKEKLQLPFALPNVVPYLMRKRKLGKSLHGRVRFSEKKLRGFGFVYPLGLEKAVLDVCCQGVE